MPARPQPRTPTVYAHPLQHTTASIMLAIACDASDKSFTEMGFAMGYNNRSSLSQMASGIATIPIDAAARIAQIVGLDEAAFTLAVMHQRNPEAVEAVVEALAPGTQAPVLPAMMLHAMRARLLERDVAFAKDAHPIIARPLPWTDVTRDLLAL